MNEQTKEKQFHRIRNQTDGCWRGEGGRGGWVKKVREDIVSNVIILQVTVTTLSKVITS